MDDHADESNLTSHTETCAVIAGPPLADSGPVTPLVATGERPKKPEHDGPWMWETKFARRFIRESLDGDGTVNSGLSVYGALCEIASNAGTSSFIATVAHIASNCGLKDRCVRQRLGDLETIMLITVSAQALKTPSRYTILSVRHLVPDVRHLLPNDRHPTSFDPTPTSEERKESKRNERRQVRIAALPDDAWLASLGSDPAYLGLSVAIEAAKCRRWCETNRRTFSRRLIVNWLNRIERPINAPGCYRAPDRTADLTFGP